MNNEHGYLADIALYVVGALDAERSLELRAHLRECSICGEEYEQLAPVADALELLTDFSESPSPLLKRRVMRAVSKPQAPRGLMNILAAACVAFALGIGATLTVMSDRQAQLAAEVADVTSPTSRHFSVPHGQVIRAGKHVYIALSGASALPPGKVYEAWTLPVGHTKMEPSTTFSVRAGSALVRLPANADRLAAVALSVEPAGGSMQPTTTPLFVVRFPS